MSFNKPIRRVAIIGTGVIGASIKQSWQPWRRVSQPVSSGCRTGYWGPQMTAVAEPAARRTGIEHPKVRAFYGRSPRLPDNDLVQENGRIHFNKTLYRQLELLPVLT